MVKVGDPGVQTQELLSAFPPFESLLRSLLSSCRSVFLLNDVVTPGCGDHLLMVDVDQAGDLSNRGSVTAELIGMVDLWDIVFSQQPGQEGLRRFGVPMPLKEDVEYETVLVYCSPEPMSDAVHARTYLVGVPGGAVLQRMPSTFLTYWHCR